ncbi:hypothetical protein GNF64_14050 [Clostridium perfringens]|nr:hypothetical protein [Clostridium perfringens]
MRVGRGAFEVGERGCLYILLIKKRERLIFKQYINKLTYKLEDKYMFEINDNKDKKVTVRFSESEIEIMEKYMDVNNIKSKTDLIRLALKNLIK